MQKKKILFVNTDLIVTHTATVSAFQFSDHVISVLSSIAAMKTYHLVLFDVQQDGAGTSMRSESGTLLKTVLSSENVLFDNVPAIGKGQNQLITTLDDYAAATYDLEASYVVCKTQADTEIAKHIGINIIYFGGAALLPPVENGVVVKSWKQLYDILRMPPRSVQVSRKTNETDIVVELNLDGTGISVIETGLGFFDHMLHQLSKHGNIDLHVRAKGDLHIDEHHTIEDTAIILGEAFAAALGDKRGIGRYGFCLPMDDCLAQVGIDFGGRNWIVWEADFKREKIGEMATEMFFHFFKSFSDAAKCNLNIKADGHNEHHKIEAIFKCFAKAIHMAVKRNPDNMQLPTTKGML